MTDYVLEIKNNADESQFYHNIANIDFYERAIRVRTLDNVSMYFDIRDMQPIKIHVVK